jgi:hypothetical protein
MGIVGEETSLERNENVVPRDVRTSAVAFQVFGRQSQTRLLHSYRD